jgi:hypothetical protein
MTRKRKLDEAAKWYEATCAKEIPAYRKLFEDLGVKVGDGELRSALDARLLRCMMEASLAPFAAPPDDEGCGLEAV